MDTQVLLKSFPISDTAELSETMFNDRCVLVVGDLMIDEYLWGDIDRISPEAPVPVVALQRENLTLGGAGNVINNLTALGARVAVASVIGGGANGLYLRKALESLGADTRALIYEENRLTTKKTRIIAANQQIIRIDKETTEAISLSSQRTLCDHIDRIIEDIDIIIVSDYAKGVIIPPLIAHLTALAHKRQIMILADPKGNDFTKYQGVTLLTPNRKEAALAAGMTIKDDQSLHEAGQRIIGTAGLASLLITCGKDGMVLFEKDLPPHKIATEARQVFDVSGAGDTVISVFALFAASGRSLREAAFFANAAAGIVVGKMGTATVTMNELITAISPRFLPSDIKHKQISDLKDLVPLLKHANKKIILTNGCFDLLHAGHIQLFAAAKKMGDILIVAIDDDDSVRKLKGPGRPVLSANERLKVLSALDSIDFVIIFATDTLFDLIRAVKPNVLVKGGNYTEDGVYGQDIVTALGGRVELIPIQNQLSSSKIIKQIKTSG